MSHVIVMIFERSLSFAEDMLNAAFVMSVVRKLQHSNPNNDIVQSEFNPDQLASGEKFGKLDIGTRFRAMAEGWDITRCYCQICDCQRCVRLRRDYDRKDT
jgi:hypothetical protein